MATSFGRKKHQDERASEASDFLCTRFQMCTKHLEPVSTLRNRFMFLQMVEKKDTNSLSETEANWTQNSIFFWTNFQYKRFLAFFTFNRVCMTKPLLRIREKCVLSRNTDYNKVWNNFQLWEIWLDGRLLSSFKSIRYTFLIIYWSKGICSLLYGDLRCYGARKITKMEEFWWNN